MAAFAPRIAVGLDVSDAVAGGQLDSSPRSA
jgi:hypothetical protein